MTEYDWLNDLKPGDKAIRCSTGIGVLDTVITVERVTPTQIIVGSDKYRKANGRRLGESQWHSCWLRQATPERIEKINYSKRHLLLSRKLEDVQWRSLPLPVLEVIAAVIDEHEAGQAKLSAALEQEATNG